MIAWYFLKLKFDQILKLKLFQNFEVELGQTSLVKMFKLKLGWDFKTSSVLPLVMFTRLNFLFVFMCECFNWEDQCNNKSSLFRVQIRDISSSGERKWTRKITISSPRCGLRWGVRIVPMHINRVTEQLFTWIRSASQSAIDLFSTRSRFSIFSAAQGRVRPWIWSSQWPFD